MTLDRSTDTPESDARRSLGSKYQLVRILGNGAMGVVWLAEDREGGEDVAAKVLRRELSTDPELVGRFIQERSILLKLTHPSIVRVHDLVVEGDRLAIVMDLVLGGDLRDVVRSEGTIPPAEACSYLIEVLDALASAHSMGVLHRDVKPDNVMLDRTGETPHARLADFSIARLAQETTVRMTGVLGTASYMAPEVFTTETASPAVDVYGAGIMLYELLVGHTPFEGGGNEYAIARRHVNAAPPPIVGLPQELVDLVADLIAKDPAHRPSAAVAADRMRALLPALAGAPRLAPVDLPMTWVEVEAVRYEDLAGDHDAEPRHDANATVVKGARRPDAPVVAPTMGGDVQTLTPSGEVILGGTVLAGQSRRSMTEAQVLAAGTIATERLPRVGTGTTVKIVATVGALVALVVAVLVLSSSTKSGPAKSTVGGRAVSSTFANEQAQFHGTVTQIKSGVVKFGFTVGGQTPKPGMPFLVRIPDQNSNQCARLEPNPSFNDSSLEVGTSTMTCTVQVQNNSTLRVGNSELSDSAISKIANATQDYFINNASTNCSDLLENYPVQLMTGVTGTANSTSMNLEARGGPCTWTILTASVNEIQGNSTPLAVKIAADWPKGLFLPELYGNGATCGLSATYTYSFASSGFGGGGCDVRGVLGPFTING